MHLQQLHIVQFKNIVSQALVFSPRLNCLVGPNGAGKTNVLDAIHFLCLCKSHRGLPDRNLVMHEAGFFRLDGRLATGEQTERAVAKYQLGQRKEFELNDTPVERLVDYVGRFPVVMIAPDDAALVTEGSEERRRLLDASLSQLSREYLDHLLAYNQLLRQRNALLKTFAEERRFDPALLAAIDRQMPPHAGFIYEQRKQFAAGFLPLLREFYREISGGKEDAGLVYQSDLSEGDFTAILSEQLEKDRMLQRTGAGPHRDDLVLSLDGYPVKKFASQGQLKSFLMALRLAQYDMLRRDNGRPPLLLLDDIFDKLDAGRVRQLVGLLIARQFGQIFITDTQAERIKAVLDAFPGDYRLFAVENGVCEEIN